METERDRSDAIKVGLIYGSDTGITEAITRVIVQKCDFWDIEVMEVDKVEVSFFQKFDFMILGLSTWYDGDLQSDWEEYYETFKTIDFTHKKVAIFGLGDQYGYDEYFVDGIGMLAEVVLENNGQIIGTWPTEGYDFTESKALRDDNTFYGLALDEDNQSDLTEARLHTWITKLQQELESTLQVIGA
ncbi:flavodoxin [Ascidiimonas aurantiaca]|uniref:flavodoxin n=1 Tax=Ascidiimonas aurantiaca TaxID=1685432 RepID=UPI0030EB5E89